MNPAAYRYVTVPKEARLLKQAINDLRIMLVGVPNRFNDPPAVRDDHCFSCAKDALTMT